MNPKGRGQPEALKLAEWLETDIPQNDTTTFADVAAELRRLHKANQALWVRLARPDPEPVAWLDNGLGVFYWACEFNDRPVPPGFEPLYAAYPRHWSNVTDDALIEEVRHRGFTIRDAQISPKREWVGLTDEEVKKIVDLNTEDDYGYDIWCNGRAVARDVETKLKEKNT